MTLILVLICTVVWAFVAVRIVRFLTKGLSGSRWHIPAFIGLFVAVMALPLLDEIVGRGQFRRLCEKSVIHIDHENASGAQVVVKQSPPTSVSWVWLPITRRTVNLVNVTTGKSVVEYEIFRAEGGRFMPSFDAGPEPVTFNGNCSSGGREWVDLDGLLRDLNMVWADKKLRG